MATKITVYLKGAESIEILAPQDPESYRASYVKGREDKVDNMSIKGYFDEILTIQMNEVRAIKFKKS